MGGEPGGVNHHPSGVASCPPSGSPTHTGRQRRGLCWGRDRVSVGDRGRAEESPFLSGHPVAGVSPRFRRQGYSQPRTPQEWGGPCILLNPPPASVRLAVPRAPNPAGPGRTSSREPGRPLLSPSGGGSRPAGWGSRQTRVEALALGLPLGRLPRGRGCPSSGPRVSQAPPAVRWVWAGPAGGLLRDYFSCFLR